MHKLHTVAVTYSGSVKHNIGEQNHRPIAGESWENLKKTILVWYKTSSPIPKRTSENNI